MRCDVCVVVLKGIVRTPACGACIEAAYALKDVVDKAADDQMEKMKVARIPTAHRYPAPPAEPHQAPSLRSYPISSFLLMSHSKFGPRAL